jgi:flagellar biosynthesis protein FlhG
MTIWAVGGGKGGTGKSFVASSLGIALAGRGRDVVMVDADLGAPNLHTFLGTADSHPNLGDFLAGQLPSLAEAVRPTPFPRLGLVRGPENTFFVANVNHYRKLKLMRHLKALRADHVILDLGPGTAFNALDFFIAAERPVLVLTPEPTSVENGYYFLKSCILRILKLYMEHYRLHDLHRRLLEQIERNSRSITAFFRMLVDEDPGFAHVLSRALKTFRPQLVMNMARNERDEILGRAIADVTRKHLTIELDFLGAVPLDVRVHASLFDRAPFMTAHPCSDAAGALRDMAERLDAAPKTSEIPIETP